MSVTLKSKTSSQPTLCYAQKNQHKRLSELIVQLLAKGWSHKDLSQAIGVDASTLYRWIKEKTIPEQDSKNFCQLAKISGGTPIGLQLYLEEKISLSNYFEGNYQEIEESIKNSKNLANQELKTEILTKIRSLDPVDIADIISSSAAYLVKSV